MSLDHREIKENVFHIGDGRGNFCTLITGEKKAVLYDTMMGFDDLRGYVSTLTDLEPMVINSHAHYDHMGGNYQFDRTWMCEADIPLLEEGLKQIPTLTGYFQRDLSRMAESFSDRERISLIEPGTILDLGGKELEIISMPGHTPGSIGILIREDRLLIVGDGISPQMCLFFPESLSVEEYRKTMMHLWDLPFDELLMGHFDHAFPKEAMHKFEACLNLPGKKRGMNYAFPALPEKRGLFYILSPRDRELGEPIGIVVKYPEQNFNDNSKLV